ncbi:MAG: hypothetical protein ACOVNU_11280 [Candidatus Kapaibacteriota bacterium]|jgi:hypothetical protein
MDLVGLKYDLHLLLDKVENEQLLRTVYDFLVQGQNNAIGNIWNSLTEFEQNEVFISYQESENVENLKSWENIKLKY